ncbi:11281_t:CDS:2, partial [Ambispora gerdemannii]
DGGIDIKGEVAVIPFVTQCKNHEEKVGVDVVREFEGVLVRESQNTIGILVTSRRDGFTRGAKNWIKN